MPQAICLRTTSATSLFKRAASAPGSCGCPSARARTIRRTSSERGNAPACVVRILPVLRIIAPPFRNALLRGYVVLLDDSRPARVIAPHQGVQLLGGGRRRVHARFSKLDLISGSERIARSSE